MKINCLTGLAMICGMLLYTACSDEFQPTGSDTGKLLPALNLNTSTVSASHNRAAASITVDDLKLSLVANDGSFAKKWDNIGQFDSDEQFPVGTYTFSAQYGALEEEGFEKPYYYAETSLAILENKTTRIALEATLANSMISIRYTDAFVDYLTSYKMSVHSEGGDYIEYGPTENRPAYVRPGEVTIIADVVKPNGLGAKLKAATITAEPRHHYSVLVDINNGSAGETVISITYDDSVVTEEVLVDISDDVLSAAAPELAVSGFEPSTLYNIIAGTTPSITPAFDVFAMAGISSVVLTTESTGLKAEGWPEEIDLVNAGESHRTYLLNKGLKVIGLFNKPDKLAKIDFTGVLSQLPYAEGGDNTHIFTVTVTDKLGKMTEPVQLMVSSEPLVLDIESVAKLNVDDDNLDVVVSYNGLNAAEEVTIERKNERGLWEQAQVNSVTALSRSANQYTFNVSVPMGETDVTLRAVSSTKTSEQAVAERQFLDYTIDVNINDVFAKHATVTILDAAGNAVALNGAKILGSADGNTFTIFATAGNTPQVNLQNLKDNTAYQVRILKDGVSSHRATFTTEAAAQIPYSDMNTWGVTASGSYWKRYVAGENDGNPWGTNNTMTTSDGAAYAYVRASGTMEDTAGRNGSCALLRTHGWGSGNTATGSKGTSGTCKYTDAGLLHLGSTRTARPSGYSSSDNKVNSCSTGPVTTDDLDCGLAFASRPSALSFWYKYSPKNSQDKGFAQIWIKDASGNIIAEKALLLDAATSFTNKTIAVEYPANAPKAAKVYVKFLSSYSMDYISRQDSNFSGPGFGNLSNGMFLGSQLWIDDIELNY